MYSDNILKDNIELSDIDTCNKKIDKVKNKTKLKSLKNSNEESKKYINLKNKLSLYIDNTIVKSNITENEINSLYKENNTLKEEYKSIIENEIDYIKSQYDYMKKAKKSVYDLFNNLEKKEVKENINRQDYNEAKDLVDNLNQNDLKKELNEYLNKINENLTQKEKEEERKRIEEENKRRNKKCMGKIKCSLYKSKQIRDI